MPESPIVARLAPHVFRMICPQCLSVEATENEREALLRARLHRCPPEGRRPQLNLGAAHSLEFRLS